MTAGRPMLYKPGEIFGQLMILSRLGNRVKVECSCGNVIEITTPALAAGKTDCGCVRRAKNSVTSSNQSLSWTWTNMLGKNGDRVCKRWRDFNSFFIDMSPRPEGTKLSLKNKDGMYELDNCFWEKV